MSTGPSGPPPEVDVIVVGGGPVGVAGALALARRGLTVRVFEKATEVYGLPRAVGVDAEIQRFFQQLGLHCLLYTSDAADD